MHIQGTQFKHFQVFICLFFTEFWLSAHKTHKNRNSKNYNTVKKSPQILQGMNVSQMNCLMSMDFKRLSNRSFKILAEIQKERNESEVTPSKNHHIQTHPGDGLPLLGFSGLATSEHEPM